MCIRCYFILIDITYFAYGNLKVRPLADWYKPLLSPAIHGWLDGVNNDFASGMVISRGVVGPQ